jgi:hypothetical protein
VGRCAVIGTIAATVVDLILLRVVYVYHAYGSHSLRPSWQACSPAAERTTAPARAR